MIYDLTSQPTEGYFVYRSLSEGDDNQPHPKVDESSPEG